MSRDAFISHQTEDGRALAVAVCTALEARNVTCWIAPRDMAFRHGYGPTIDTAIEESGAFVVILTAGAATSHYVEREAELAAHYRKRIIPVSVDGITPGKSLRFYLAGWSYFPISRSPSEQDMDRLADAVRGATSSLLPVSQLPARASRRWRTWQIVAVAAAVLTLITVATYFIVSGRGGPAASGAAAAPPKSAADIAPAPPTESHTASPPVLQNAIEPPHTSRPTPGLSGANGVVPRPSLNSSPPPASSSSSTSPAGNSEALIVDDLRLPFVRLPGGSLLLGCTTGVTTCDEPQTTAVSVAPFEMSATEVPRAVWMAVMGQDSSDFRSDDLFPVQNVTWQEAQTFVDRLNERGDGYTYHLPTEAQWEYAARANDATPPDLKAVAWLELAADPDRRGVQRVRTTRTPNRWKLFDMFGNVAEWCEDTAEGGRHRVTRGGNWMDSAASLQRSDRVTQPPSTRKNTIGVRLVRAASR
jgi:hypothetical protein